MRSHHFVLSLAVCVALAFATGVSAQACRQPNGVESLTVSGAGCALDGDIMRCDPGSSVTLTAVPRFEFTTPGAPVCTADLTWSLGDGSPAETTSGTSAMSVHHVFPSGQFQLTVMATTPIGPRGLSAEVLSAWGFFEINAIDDAIYENAAAGRIRVWRSGDTSHAATVDYFSAGEVVAASGTLSFAAGEIAKEVTLQPVNDTVDTFGKHGSLALRNPSGSAFHRGIGQISAGFQILDDDPPTSYRCTEEHLSVNESAGFATIDVERSGNLSAASEASLYIGGGPQWWLPASSYHPTFAIGQTHATVKVPVDDDYYTGTQQVTIHCSNTSSLQLVVSDDEPLPVLTAPHSIEVVETGETQIIYIPLTVTPPFGRFVSLPVGLTGNTGYLYDEYTAFTRGDGNDFIRIWITGDAKPEPDQHFQVSITGELRATIDVTVIDDDRPAGGFEFDQREYDGPESAFEFGIRRTGETTAAATVNVTMFPENAAPWPDSFAVEFAAGETSKRVKLNADDQWYTGDRNGRLRLEWEGFTGDTAFITIHDDDPQPVVSVAPVEVNEGAAGTTTTATFAFTLSAPAGLPLHVGYATQHGTANGDDYTPASGTLVIPPGTLAYGLPVNVRGDNAAEADETFTLNVTSCCSGMGVLANDTATATIRNDDGEAAFLRFEALSTSWNESQKWLVATLVREGKTALAAEATVKLTSNAPRRFSPVAVRFAANELRKIVRFYIDDNFYSGSAPAQLEVFTGNVREDLRDLTIEEDEGRPVITISGVTVTEGTGDKDALFTVSITPPSWSSIPLDVVTLNGTATIGPDFTFAGGRIQIPAGASRHDIHVNIRGDDVSEPDETFEVRVQLPLASAATLGDSGFATGTILDDERAGARLARYEPAAERGTRVPITIDFITRPGANITVLLTSSDPSLVSVPPSIDVPAGAEHATFEAIANASGHAVVHIALPNATLDAPLTVFARLTPIITPTSIHVPLGGIAHVTLSLLPAGDTNVVATLQTANPAIAASDPAVLVVPGASPTFNVYGASLGTTVLTITLPAEHGGIAMQVPVEVVESVARRRGARH
jgi:hypothetical protein